MGKISQIETMGSVDGPGIRIVIFFQGCPLRCLFCHNPEMWDVNGGKEYTSKQILDIILKYKHYLGDTGGVTFSGGEPLMQSAFLLDCLKLCKDNNIHTCLDTSGVGDKNYFNNILNYTDLVLFDIKAINADDYKYITGQDISSSLTFLKECQRMNKKMWIRQVIIPEINDNLDYIKKLGLFIKNIKNVKKIELLPYHTLGISKYEKLKIPYRLINTKPMNAKKCSLLEQELYKIVF